MLFFFLSFGYFLVSYKETEKNSCKKMKFKIFHVFYKENYCVDKLVNNIV